ncbi:MAG: hypothetical protein ACI9VL_000722, partial [Colwellia sp.]
ARDKMQLLHVISRVYKVTKYEPMIKNILST